MLDDSGRGSGKQIQLYRSMNAEQRLKIALDLHTFVWNLSKAGIQQQHLDATDEVVDWHLRQRIEMGRIQERKGILS